MKIKIIFFGTPNFAADILKHLLDNGVPVVGVVTQPDRLKGRSLQLASPPVKALVLETTPHIPLFQPEKASQDPFIQQLAVLQADLFVVVAYGQILTQKLLDVPRLGCINVHASLLPKYRGAAPIHRCLMAGEQETGVVIQKMVKQLDAGDVIATSKVRIPPDMSFGELERSLNALAKPLLLSILRVYETGIPEALPQNHLHATYAPKIELTEGEVHWDKGARELHNLIRAFSPRPGAWCWVHIGKERKRLKILSSQCTSENGSPGQLLHNETVACAQGALQLITIQPEGKKAMRAADWLRNQRNISFI